MFCSILSTQKTSNKYVKHTAGHMDRQKLVVKCTSPSTFGAGATVSPSIFIRQNLIVPSVFCWPHWSDPTLQSPAACVLQTGGV